MVMMMMNSTVDLLFLMSISGQFYLLMKHFLTGSSRRQRVTFFIQMILASYFNDILAIIAIFSIYPAYNKQNKEGKFQIAIFAPLVGVVLKVISRISSQGLWKFTHPMIIQKLSIFYRIFNPQL